MDNDFMKYGGRRDEPPYQSQDAARIEMLEGLLWWSLYHHQGSISEVGQPIRVALGISRHAHLTEAQINFAKQTVEDIKINQP